MTRIMMKRPVYAHVPGAHEHMRKQRCLHRHVGVNILEREDGFEIQLAVPGMEKSDFEIYIKDNVLHVGSKEKGSLEEGKQPDYRLKQFDYSGFSRRFVLSEELDQESVDAKYEQGILQVRISRKNGANAEIHKRIEIK